MMRNVMKFVLLMFMFVLFLCTNNISVASDYKYKILDPQYNPQALELIEGKLDVADSYSYEGNKKFDFGAFFGIFALILFPFMVLAVAAKTFKNVSSNLNKNSDSLLVNNIKIEPSKQTETEDIINHIYNNQESKPVSSVSSVTNAIKSEVNFPKEEHKPAQNMHKNLDILAQNCLTSVMEKIPNPMLLNTSPLSSNKGLCVVEYNKKYSLIGYINDQIFLLDQFDSLKTTEIRSRLTETQNNIDRYIVRLGEYKALVEVKEKEMKLLLEL